MNRLSRDRQQGFTMIEIMVVVVIVAILAAIAVPIYIDYVESARASEAKSVIGNIYNASKMYYQTYGQWPADVEELERSGQLRIDQSTKRQWIFAIQISDNSGTITATSTAEMDGGEGNVVQFDVETGQYSGYGTPESAQ
ncbi:MAG: prepilin-type N-terminal cleavage/methylation domain-containing protein [Candidatus Neomarinimicrobiota bacterium]|nr:MAG: prepilin-type N-terminal cleavage/methylation domain-containing protein [Candidatus Neomarinimicrobiota bacterium]